MAIYHLSHKSVGRSTHAAGTAGAHADYITRATACDLLIGEHMPIPEVGSRGGPAREWLDQQEEADRKNARVIDKLTLALPHELDPEQQVELVRNFAHSMTNGEAPFLAAFHRLGKDADNQHCHLILRDRHIETGKRVWGNENRKPTEIMRKNWEQVCNAALEQHNTRIDRRTLKEQGIDRKPQKHIGAVAKAIEADGRKSWKLEALREEQQISKSQKQNRVAESRTRALDPNGLGKAPAMKFLRKAAPSEEITTSTAIFLQNARFLERLWEFSAAVTDDTLRFAEEAFRSSAAKVRGLVLPSPSAMSTQDRYAEHGRLGLINEFAKRSEGELYKVIALPDRLKVLDELVSRSVTIREYAESLREFKIDQLTSWKKEPNQADENKLIAVLDHTMSFVTKPSAQYQFDQTQPPTGFARDGFEKALNEYVPLADLVKAWDSRQQEPDMIVKNAQIMGKIDARAQLEAAQEAQRAAERAAQEHRVAQRAAEWERARPEREAREKAAQEAQRAAERAAQARMEEQERQEAQKAAEARREAQEAAKRREAEAKANPKKPDSDSGPSGPSM